MPRTMKQLFAEDDAPLQYDPAYPNIRQWWWQTFGSNFDEVWRAAALTEVDNGDSFSRTVEAKSRKLFVTQSFDGYYVHEWVDDVARSESERR